MITLLDVQNSTIRNIASVCVTSTQFNGLLNEVVSRLMVRGDWVGTTAVIRVCLSKGCVTWPRYVDRVRKINGCRSTIAVRSQWYEFLEYRGDRHLHEWQGWIGQERNMTQQGYAPTYNDIYGPNCTVRVVAEVQADVGASVTIFGVDNNNQPLQTQNPDGSWSRGITIKAGIPFGSSSNAYFVSRIDRVVKPVTQSNLLLYAYDTVQNVLWDLAVYEPSETNPSYLRYQLEGYQTGIPSCGGGCLETVIALIKLKHLPITVPSDWVIIDNIAALKFGIMALKREEANDFQEAKAMWQNAYDELNRQLEDATPDYQFPAQNQVFAGAVFRNKQF